MRMVKSKRSETSVTAGVAPVEEGELMCLRKLVLDSADVFDALSGNIHRQIRQWEYCEDLGLAIAVKGGEDSEAEEDVRVLCGIQRMAQVAGGSMGKKKRNKIKTYLSSQTPPLLVKYREEELQNLRGDGTGKHKEWERIYDYDVYNDLGDPDSDDKLARPILGGSSTYPYPRRVRTCRKPTRRDPKSEKPGVMYVPRDENFGHLKSSDFLTYGIKSLSQEVLPRFQDAIFGLNFTKNEFDSFDEVFGLYEGGVRLPTDILSKISPLPVLKGLFENGF